MERTREMVVGGRYRLRSKLGKGGMGTVWRAFDESLHREVALKVIYKISSEDEVVDRFRQEARAAARIRHINIVEIFDQGEDDEHHFISMELVDGSSLDKHLRQRRFSWQEILQITAQMCDGVSAAHSHGIIHRDLKPANIVLTQDSKGGLLVKVLDFGVAANLTPGIEAVQNASRRPRRDASLHRARAPRWPRPPTGTRRTRGETSTPSA
jgi:serine/threonine protein kinase